MQKSLKPWFPTTTHKLVGKYQFHTFHLKTCLFIDKFNKYFRSFISFQKSIESKSLNSVNDEKLIECVRNYPVLYKSSDKNYKDNSVKENAWKEISHVIGKNGMYYN